MIVFLVVLYLSSFKEIDFIDIFELLLDKFENYFFFYIIPFHGIKDFNVFIKLFDNDN
jgi:hypothetical protein